MFDLPAVCGEQIWAIAGAINGDFAFGSAIDCANFLAFGRAIALGAAFLANWADRFTGHPYHSCLSFYTRAPAQEPLRQRRRLLGAGAELFQRFGIGSVLG